MILFLSIRDNPEIQMPIMITRKTEINKSPMVNGNINDGGYFIAKLYIDGFVFQYTFEDCYSAGDFESPAEFVF